MNAKTKKLFALVLMLTFLAPLLSSIIINDSISSNDNLTLHNDILNTQGISKEDFEPLLNEEKHGLGNITVNDINFGSLGIGFHLNSDEYPQLNDDYENDALNITFEGIKFIETNAPAISDNLDDSVTLRNTINVRLNESIKVRYNTTNPVSEGYLLYGPRLYDIKLDEMYIVKEGSSVVQKVDEVNYSIDNNNFLYFDYEYYFSGTEILNFTMFLIWDYNLTVFPWFITQHEESIIPINTQEQDFVVKYDYVFALAGGQYEETIGNDFSDNPGFTSAKELLVNVTINPLDRHSFDNLILRVNYEIIPENDFNTDYLNADNSITVEELNASGSLFNLTFTANFTLKFIDPVGETWSVDRLFSQRDIRERIFLPSLISGPEHIYVKNLKIFENTITIDHFIDYTSLFNRNPTSPCKNATIYDWESEPVLITNKLEEKLGLNVTLPYIIKGETCPFSIKYNASENLKITIKDNIGMPLIGVTVELYYYGKIYGTYISNEDIQPLASLTTDENAKITLKNVPMGYYTIKIYQFGILQVVTTVNTYEENHLITSIIHFPSWILIFGIFSLFIFALGYRLHQKNKKR